MRTQQSAGAETDKVPRNHRAGPDAARAARAAPRTADRRRGTPGHTAVLDGIGLQWVLDPSTDVVESISTYVDRAILGWRRTR